MSGDFLITADASQVSGADFFHAIFGGNPRDRAAEAEYLRIVNEHWAAAKAKSDAISAAGPRDGESRLELLVRALAPINAHDKWRAEQNRLWAMGAWVAPEQVRRAA